MSHGGSEDVSLPEKSVCTRTFTLSAVDNRLITRSSRSRCQQSWASNNERSVVRIIGGRGVALWRERPWGSGQRPWSAVADWRSAPRPRWSCTERSCPRSWIMSHDVAHGIHRTPLSRAPHCTGADEWNGRRSPPSYSTRRSPLSTCNRCSTRLRRGASGLTKRLSTSTNSPTRPSM